MAERTRPALGLSIGATNLAAVTPGHAITRKPVLTLYRHRPPEVGVPSDNPRLDEPGLVISDFVDRVGDQVGIVAADGSMHRSEALVADGLRALAYTATGGRPLPESVAVTYPAHWAPKAVDALGSALSRVSEWSNRGRPLTLMPDAAATLLAVRANPGIPARGIVAVCDFGGSGTSITLVDAAADYHPVAPTLRHHDFSGDLIDQALLTAVMDNMASTGSFDPAGTSAIGSLSRLRVACRGAKEQLSSCPVTTLADELPNSRGGIRLTRNELDDAIRDSLSNLTAALEEALVRNGIRSSDLVAVISVGGGANLPAVTTMLSGRLRVPVVATPRPQLTAAVGGALRAARGPGDTARTALTPAAPATATARAVASASGVSGASQSATSVLAEDPVSRQQSALAWSEADDDSRAMPALEGLEGGAAGGGEAGGSGYTAARPALKFEREEHPRPEQKPQVIPWYRLPTVIIVGTAVAVLLVGLAVAVGLDSGDNTTPAPGVSNTPASSAPVSAPPPVNGTPQSAPAQPQATVEPAHQQAPPATQAPPAIQPPPAAQPPPFVQPPVPAPPAAPPIPAIPPIPHIPVIGVPIPGAPHPVGHR